MSFATGLPHYGHILASTVKDVVTRYMHQLGYHVERRFGWDCHGLPVEFEIDKMLGIKGPNDVMKMGIDKYNGECRKIVTRYVNEWEHIIGRIGRWIDFKNDYKTLYPWYMESIWWIFKQLYNKGLVYHGNKVMPYSTACNTPLSNFESSQNYKDVIDPAVTVTLPLLDDEDGAALLIWTTTPWTLPSNLAACVNPSLTYACIKQLSTEKKYIVLEARIQAVFAADDYKILKTFPGIELKDLKYEPIFPYYKELQKNGAFRVLVDDYVTSESGTGIVHQAAYFGEDDYRVCLAAGVITHDQEPICPIDASGKLTKPIIDFEGQYIKDADKNIIAALKSQGRLFNHSQVKHSYPFCWRSDTPLIYRAIPSWFIRVEKIIDKLLECASRTYWVPEFVQDKRFGNWLREARDWAVSRNRYWGTPIPIWISPNGEEICCIGSIAELEQLTGTSVTDLHRESIDHLTIPSKISGNPPLRRISEVFDCWFESGSMPYAQQHYPFENRKNFNDFFPASFIAEGIDQTRGWFYTLLVISTSLFGEPPFENVIANGLILARDGQKMSKRKKNYPDPMEIISKYGADALRLYLINSPVVRAENLRFKEDGVRDIIKDVFLPWYNAFRFLFQSIECFYQDHGKQINFSNYKLEKNNNIMDRWILLFTQSLLFYICKEMHFYHLYNVLPRITKYIDYLTNWYVRMNRKRLRSDGGQEDAEQAILTLYDILLDTVKMMAPFTPFLSETMYQYFRKISDLDAHSVHYLMLSPPKYTFRGAENIERAVSRMQAVIELGRVIRDRKTIPLKFPLSEIVVVHQDQQYLRDIKSLENYIVTELNVRKVTLTNDKSKYGITLRAEPNFKVLGLRLKQDFKPIAAAIKALTDMEINEMIADTYRKINNHRITLSEVRLIFKTDSLSSDQYEIHSDNDVLIVLNVTLDSSMQDEGTAREIINRIQKLRKKAHLVPTDEIEVFYKATGDINRIAVEYKDLIESSIKAKFRDIKEITDLNIIIIDEKQQLRVCELYVALTKKENVEVPCSKWVNIELLDLKSKYCKGAVKGLILLEVAGNYITLENFKKQVSNLFGIQNNFKLLSSNGLISSNEELLKLSGKTVFGCKEMPKDIPGDVIYPPFCQFLNIIEDGKSFTLILENPVGNFTCSKDAYVNFIYNVK